MELTDELRAQIKAQLTASPKRSKEKKSETIARSYRYNRGRTHYSDALGVSPDQIEEARAHLRSHGIAAEFHDDGRIAIQSEKQWRDIARAGGMYTGRDGFGAKDKDGNKIMTGREQGLGRQALKHALAKEMRGYPKEFDGPQTRRR
jgi:hypothetical protein